MKTLNKRQSITLKTKSSKRKIAVSSVSGIILLFLLSNVQVVLDYIAARLARRNNVSGALSCEWESVPFTFEPGLNRLLKCKEEESLDGVTPREGISP